MNYDKLFLIKLVVDSVVYSFMNYDKLSLIKLVVDSVVL